jgi:hypothetical protein
MAQLGHRHDGRGGDDTRPADQADERGVPLDRLWDRVDNCIEAEEGACGALVDRVTDPDRDIVDVSRSTSYEFAVRFADQFD